jgi:hypothetical protein
MPEVSKRAACRFREHFDSDFVFRNAKLVAQFSMTLKCLPEPLHFKAGAKQREQTSEQNHAALGGQENVDTAIKFGEVSETATQNSALPNMKPRRPKNRDT